jgi:hypothetical protein
MNKYITMSIPEKLQLLFPPKIFSVGINGEGTGIVSVIITNKTEKDVICVNFTIRVPQGIIQLNSVLKCSVTGDDGTGTALLSKVETFAKQLGITHITLDDESNINICGNEIDLAHFKILTTGMSWYNKLGYFSRSHEYDMKANSAFIASLIATYLTQDMRNTFPPASPDETVQSYVTRIFTSIRQQEPPCSEEDKARGKYLHMIVNHLKGNISYNTKLTKEVITQQRAGRRKLRTKRKKPNKKKRTRKHK